jgi:hypothetical protein
MNWTHSHKHSTYRSVKNRRALPLLAAIVLLTCAVAPACGGPRLTTLAPGVYGEAGEAGTTALGQAGATVAPEAGAAGLSAPPDAGAGGTAGDGGAHG